MGNRACCLFAAVLLAAAATAAAAAETAALSATPHGTQLRLGSQPRHHAQATDGGAAHDSQGVAAAGGGDIAARGAAIDLHTASGEVVPVLMAWSAFAAVMAYTVWSFYREQAAADEAAAAAAAAAAAVAAAAAALPAAAGASPAGAVRGSRRLRWASPFAPLAGSTGSGGGGGNGVAGNGFSGTAAGKDVSPLRAPLLPPLLAGSGSYGRGAPYGAGATGGGRSDSGTLPLPSALTFQVPPGWAAGAGASGGGAAAAAGAARSRLCLPPAHSVGLPGSSLSTGGAAAGAAPPPEPMPAASFVDVAPPLCVLCADAVANARLLAWWGLSPPSPARWPSYLLLALLLAPHAAAAAVELLRVFAAAAVPPTLRACAPAPPAERLLAAVAGWVLAAPWWAALPTLVLLAGPTLALLGALMPLTLPLHLVGLASHEAAVRYVRLLQACSALTLAPGSAVLLTFLLLTSGLHDQAAPLTPDLYWVVLLAAFADMVVGLRLELRRRATEELLLARERRVREASLAVPNP